MNTCFCITHKNALFPGTKNFRLYIFQIILFEAASTLLRNTAAIAGVAGRIQT